jgi:hypothetical protein
MKVKVKNYDAFKYMEVWIITEMRDGCVYKTRPTGKYVKSDWINPDINKYYLASLSTSLLRNDEFELELFEVSDEKP